MDNPVNRRTVAIELAYNYRKGQLQQRNQERNEYNVYENIEEKAREWAEQNAMEFEEEAQKLLTKPESPL
jgi:hypothetical protein